MQPVRDVFEGYGDEAPDDRPLGAYAGLGALFSVEFALFLYAVRRTGRTLPERVEARDLLLLGVATHKIARIMTKEMITSPLRAPFTRYQKPAGAGEINESTRGTGLRHAIGELLTCPFCFAVWVASYPHLWLRVRAARHAPDRRHLRHGHALRHAAGSLRFAQE